MMSNALKAFKVNGIDYVVKPYSVKSIKEAIDKFKRLTGKESSYKKQALLKLLSELDVVKSNNNASILVHYHERIIPIRLDTISLFYVEDKYCYLLTEDSKRYMVNKSLEELEILSGSSFFRINRQILINRLAIVDASQYFRRKLALRIHIPFDETITVSKNKVSLFLNWLAKE